jgi:hypothetical protein
VRSALAVVPAAYQVGFDLDRDEVYVGYDAAAGDAKTASAPMVRVIKAVGFDPWLKGDAWPEAVPELVVLPRL